MEDMEEYDPFLQVVDYIKVEDYEAICDLWVTSEKEMAAEIDLEDGFFLRTSTIILFSLNKHHLNEHAMRLSRKLKRQLENGSSAIFNEDNQDYIQIMVTIIADNLIFDGQWTERYLFLLRMQEKITMPFLEERIETVIRYAASRFCSIIMWFLTVFGILDWVFDFVQPPFSLILYAVILVLIVWLLKHTNPVVYNLTSRIVSQNPFILDWRIMRARLKRQYSVSNPELSAKA